MATPIVPEGCFQIIFHDYVESFHALAFLSWYCHNFPIVSMDDIVFEIRYKGIVLFTEHLAIEASRI
jgi:hypothetical protein